MKRAGAALALVAACAGAPLREVVTEPPAASAPVASASGPAIEAEVPEVSPAPEPRLDDARASRLARWTAIARGVYDAYANVSPSPVVRGYTEVPYIQFQSDRRARGAMAWVEGPTLSLHHAVEPATKLEPCARPLALGGEARLRGVVAHLVRSADHDELRLGEGAKTTLAKLPRGASHGACVGRDETRVWIAWSTPTTPAELFSVSRIDGTTRPLRLDARPGLAALTDARAAAIELGPSVHAAVLEPLGTRVATAILIDDDDAPLARWSALARFLASVAVRVIVVHAKDVDAAVGHVKAPSSLVATRRPATAPPGVRAITVAEDPATLEGELPEGGLIIAAGDAVAIAARSASARAKGRVWVAPGAAPRDFLPAAWARVADAVVEGL